MPITATNVTRPGAEMSEHDFRVLVSKLTIKNTGILDGVDTKLANSNTIEVSDGYVVSSGSLIKISAGTITVPSETTDVKKYLVVRYDPLTGEDATVLISNTVLGDRHSAFTNGITDVILATVWINSSGITKIAPRPAFSPADASENYISTILNPDSTVSLKAGTWTDVGIVNLKPGRWIGFIQSWFKGVSNSTGVVAIRILDPDKTSYGTAQQQCTTNQDVFVQRTTTIFPGYDYGPDGADFTIQLYSTTARTISKGTITAQFFKLF